MVADEHLEQLSRRLDWQSPVLVDTVVGEITPRLLAAVRTLVASLRWAAAERPLVTLLLSSQIGYLIGRMGHRYARR